MEIVTIISGTGGKPFRLLSAHSTRKEKHMRKIILVIALLSIVLILGGVRPAVAQMYTQQNLVSDGTIPAVCVDPNLVNAWGLAASATSPWWVSDNGTGKTSLYSVNKISPTLVPPCPVAFTVFTVPGATSPSAPTGQVSYSGTGFVLPPPLSLAPSFIISNEDGTISGFKGALEVAVNNSASGAVYKGLAIAVGAFVTSSTATGDFLYATNFHAGTVDVFNSTFVQVNSTLPPGAFTDSSIPKGYAPFGIQNLNGVIYVTYALQDAAKHDDVAGEGHGFVDAFDTTGTLLRRVASKGDLNSPWGLALAPPNFGSFSGDLLVGNFGDGKITAFDPGAQRGNGEYRERGQLLRSNGHTLVINDLWGLAFGHGGPANGATNTLFFTAGSGGEMHGLFGSLVEAPKGKDK
jgi:uncharacterized protein (TIGR03118 family)